MAALPSKDLLILAAAKLSQSVPSTDWDDFLRVLEHHASEVRDDCVQAPIDMLQVAQGRAQQASRFLQIFKDCRTQAARISSNITTSQGNRR